ncbi:hypothetical protein [Halorussus halobius]|uniref:hypothetical protein n=1 Tax=Halorussus halobius TaxID=1710537 RepID=UPI001092E125|nr:hypothetical protein [Halorussus halobius]
MKKAILYTTLLALATTTLLAGVGAGATVADTSADAGADLVTTPDDVGTFDYCVDPIDCDCRYDPSTGEYYGDCDEYT